MMDPNAALDLIIADPSERTSDGAVGDLREWLARDGFAPDLRSAERLDAFRRWVYAPELLQRECVGTYRVSDEYCSGCGQGRHSVFRPL